MSSFLDIYTTYHLKIELWKCAYILHYEINNYNIVPFKNVNEAFLFAFSTKKRSMLAKSFSDDNQQTLYNLD